MSQGELVDKHEILEPTEGPHPTTQGESESSVLRTAPTWDETPGSLRTNLDNIENS